MFPTPVALALAALAAGAQQTAQPPGFKSGIELVIVDAQVVDRKGNPIPGLTAENFQVAIDGKKRAVSTVDYIDASTGLPFAAPGKAAAPASSAKMMQGFCSTRCI